MRVHVVPVLSDNYVWLIEGQQGQCAVVDLGEAEPVLEAIEERNLTPIAILLTHHHGDHTAGIAAFRKRFPVPVIGPSREAGQFVTQPKRGGDEFTLPQIGTFSVLDTPGHTLGGITFVTDGAAFTGDTLFTAGCGRLFEGTSAQMLDSLDQIAKLPDDTLIYCGHEYTADSLTFAAHAEPDNTDIARRVEETAQRRAAGNPTVPATLGLEKATNPFLRLREPALREAIERHAGKRIEDDAEAFATVRRWKDDFDGLPPL